MKKPYDTARIRGYHAHVYYRDRESRARAEILRTGIEDCGLKAVLGAWHDEPVGPHPVGSYQIAFENPDFGQLVPWLALNRGGLSILVHPNTDEPVADHSDHALWLGAQLPLDLEVLRRYLAAKKAP